MCVASIQQHTTEPYELIFVDNGSTDGTVEWAKSRGSSVESREPEPGEPVRVTVIVNTENRGFPAAANQGIRAASGGQILLLNNDTVVTAGWLTRLLRALDSRPDPSPQPSSGKRGEGEIGLVGPVSNFVSGPQQIEVPYLGRGSRVESPGPVGKSDCDLGMLEEFARDLGRARQGQTVETDRLVGFCLLIRRQVIERVGLFDERFGIGNFEDDDYCRRAREAGFKLAITRDAFVHHFGGATFRAASVDFGALIQQNERLFREKWQQVSGEGLVVSGQERSMIHSSADPQPSTLNPQLSLCMIARDNERTIRAALESVRPWVDEMVVVDTGSTDRTPEIAAELGARVFHFPWCDDFSAARNESIRHALGQWIFWMDTDDTIDQENGHKLQELIRRIAREPPPGVLGFLMKVRCPGSALNGQHGAIEVDHVKLFRNLPELRFEGRIHEQILMAIRRAGGTVAWTDIFIEHSGSDQSPEGRAKKLERDLRILDREYKERPDHPFVLFNLGMTHDQAGNYEKAIGFLWQSIGRSGDDDSHLRKAYALLVSSYRQLGRPVTAWETCVKGLNQFSDDLELRFQQAALHYTFGRLPEAARAYEELRAMQSSQHLSSVDRGLQGYRAAHNLAGIYAELGELSKAEILWRQVIDECPWFAPAWHGLADVLVRQDKTDEALQCAEALRAHPELDREAGRLRRRVLVGRGEVQAALDELNGDLEAVSTALANGERQPPGLSDACDNQGAHAPRSPARLRTERYAMRASSMKRSPRGNRHLRYSRVNRLPPRHFTIVCRTSEVRKICLN